MSPKFCNFLEKFYIPRRLPSYFLEIECMLRTYCHYFEVLGAVDFSAQPLHEYLCLVNAATLEIQLADKTHTIPPS